MALSATCGVEQFVGHFTGQKNKKKKNHVLLMSLFAQDFLRRSVKHQASLIYYHGECGKMVPK